MLPSVDTRFSRGQCTLLHNETLHSHLKSEMEPCFFFFLNASSSSSSSSSSAFASIRRLAFRLAKPMSNGMGSKSGSNWPRGPSRSRSVPLCPRSWRDDLIKKPIKNLHYVLLVTSKALVTRSDALVTSSEPCYPFFFGEVGR